MAIDRSKLTIEANAHVAKGNYRKAVTLYERIVAADPDDDRAMLRLADLQVRAGHKEAAIRTFHELADAYVVRGFFLKAVSVYKQVLRVNPVAVDVRARLGDLYYQLGLLSDALVFYNEVAQHALDRGDAARYAEMLQRILDIDPSNVGFRIKLAEHLAKQSNELQGAHHLRLALETLDEAGRFDEYARVADRYLHIVPDDVDVSERLARILLESGKARRALGRIQTVFRNGLYRTSSIDLLAETLRSAGEDERAPVVLVEVAHLAASDARQLEAEQAWRRVLDFDPAHPEALKALGVAPGAEEPDEEILTFEIVEPDEPDAVDHSEAIQKILSETDIYLKYSLHAKALEHLAQALALDPNDAGAIQRRRDVYVAMGESASAAVDTARLAVLAFDEEPVRAESLAAEARGLDAGNAEVESLLASMGRRASSPPLAPAVPPPTETPPTIEPPVEPALPFASAPPPPPLEVGDLFEEAAADDARRSSVDEFDALFAAVDAENVDSAGTRALDEELSLIRAIDSVFDTAGISQGLPAVSGGGDEVHGADIPDELALLLDDLDEQAATGGYALAHATMFELMSEFPEHAEVILSRADLLADLQAGAASGGAVDSAGEPAPGDADLVFELDDDSDEDAAEALVFELDDDSDEPEEDPLVFALEDDEDEQHPDNADEADDADDLLFDLDADDEVDSDNVFPEEDVSSMTAGADGASDPLDDGAPPDPADALDATPVPEVLPPAFSDALEQSSRGGFGPDYEDGTVREGDELRVPVLSGEFPAVGEAQEPDAFADREPTDVASGMLEEPTSPDDTAALRRPAASVIEPDDSPASSPIEEGADGRTDVSDPAQDTPTASPAATRAPAYTPFSPEPSLDRHFDEVDDPFAGNAVAAPPAPPIDAPVGRPSAEASLEFGPLRQALDAEPAGTVAQASQIRASGSGMETIALLQPEFYGPWAVAAVYVTARANLDLGMFLEALTFLESLEGAPGVGADDIATLRYLQAIGCEALGESDRAKRLLQGLLEEGRDDAFPDLAARIERL